MFFVRLDEKVILVRVVLSFLLDLSFFFVLRIIMFLFIFDFFVFGLVMNLRFFIFLFLIKGCFVVGSKCFVVRVLIMLGGSV